MKFILKFNQDYAFFIFISIIAGVFFIASGVPFISAFLTGVFIYIFLRFSYFLWNIIMKFFKFGDKLDV